MTAPDDVVVLQPELDRRRQRVGRAEHRAVVEERERLAGVGRLGEPLVDRRVRVLAEAVGDAPRGRRRPRAIIVDRRARLHEAVEHAAHARRPGGAARPGAATARRRAALEQPAQLASRVTAGAWTRLVVAHAATRRARRRAARGPTGSLPLRALRSMSAHSTRVGERRRRRARGRCACRCPCGSCRRGSPTTSTGARRRGTARGTRRRAPSRAAWPARRARAGSRGWRRGPPPGPTRRGRWGRC